MELKECPFCGSKAHMAENVSVYGTMFAACCDDVEGCPPGRPAIGGSPKTRRPPNGIPDSPTKR